MHIVRDRMAFSLRRVLDLLKWKHACALNFEHCSFDPQLREIAE